ncbi:hypothetical protein Clacol_007779 [Clathrus columnatus]|uniref:Cytochrome P450 n=2 Tax=Clathrus columnatus TaxID=1419009 RepID=A0AAV5ANN0_9AGAM|nr:hypothetical protein Clacol_007779 [Clathrus columnatus]
MSTSVLIQFSLFAALTSIILLINSLRKDKSKYAHLPFPPGPKPLPIIGNALDLPQEREYATYHEWSKLYGDVIHAQAFGQHILIINSVDAARELLDKRSGIHSDRPHVPMVHDPALMHMDWSFPMMRYDARWKRHRRLFVQHLNPVAMEAYSDKILATAHGFLRNVLADPTTFHRSLKHAIGSILLGVVYGYEVLPENDPFVKLAEDTVTLTTDAISPAWVPGNKFKPYAAKDQGKAVPSVVSKGLAEITQTDTPDPEKLDDLMKLGAVMYAAGADTTITPVQFAILNAILNPEIQRRAQAELNSVLASPDSRAFRLPTFEDMSALPYITALMKESLRWVPVQPISLPHASLEEDEFRGWRIPKGSIILPNAWTMLHNEAMYKDPFVFRPERFLRHGDHQPEPDPSGMGVFGFGRRACPGDHIAEKVIGIELASLFAVFNFAPPKDNDGNDIDLTYATIPGSEFILHTPHYPCSITVRSKIAEERILGTTE